MAKERSVAHKSVDGIAIKMICSRSKRSLFLFLFLSAVLVSLAQSVEQLATTLTATGPEARRVNEDCSSSLDSILLAEQQVQDESKVRTYILCPHTDYEISSSFLNGKAVSGQSPLLISKDNVRIQCGHNGSSRNSCILKGGIFQMRFLIDERRVGGLSSPEIHSITNVYIQGLTFEAAKSFNVWIEHAGGLTLDDCIFKKNHNIAPVYISLPYLEDKETLHDRLLAVAENSDVQKIAEEFHMRRSRRTESSKTEAELRVAVTNCTFLNNTVWSFSGMTVEGLVVAENASIIISHTSFLGTIIESIQLGFLVGIFGGELSMHDNCFIGNDSRIAPVVTERLEIGTFAGNFVQRMTSQLSPTNCEFLAKVSGGGYLDLEKNDFDQVTFECQQSDSNVCLASSLNDHYRVPCVNSLDSIYYNEDTLKEDSIVRTYILCPNTEYKIGSMNGDTGTPVDGFRPIVIGRPNVHILCGADGKSKNMCVLSGGVFQISLFDEFGSKTAASNTMVRGVTFTHASSVNFWVQFPGKVFLQDCIFNGNVNLASIYLDFAREQSLHGNLHVTVIDSSFIGNVVGTISEQSTGVITNRNATLRIVNSAFIGTVDRQIDTKVINYVVGNMLNGSLEMTGNCFIDNQVQFAPVISHSHSLPSVSNNHGQEKTATGTCEFIAAYTEKEESGDNPSTQTDFSCIDFDGRSCYDLATNPGVDASAAHVEKTSHAASQWLTGRYMIGLGSLVLWLW